MMTINEMLVNQNIRYDKLNKNIKRNIDELLYKISIVRFHYDKIMKVNSGYRTSAYNKKIGGAKNSYHTQGLAIDVHDPTHNLHNWLTQNTIGQEIVTRLDLYLEDSNYTKTWCHIQLRAPKSGNRIFIP